VNPEPANLSRYEITYHALRFTLH